MGPMDKPTLSTVPAGRTAGGLCAHDLGTKVRFHEDGTRHTLLLAAVHHDTGTHGQPVTYIANLQGISYMLPSDTPLE